MMLDRQYGPLADGGFIAADTGTFGVYVDITGNIFLIDFAKDTLRWRQRLQKDDFRALREEMNPKFELSLDENADGSYLLVVRDLEYGGAENLIIPRSLVP